jgi:intracellular sulfur oxidation DsrE/DsrF family protein
MRKPYLLAVLWAGALALMLGSPFARADEAKPFAVAKYALQLSSGGRPAQTLVLNVAGNLVKHYGQDRVQIEVVAFGPGLRLLLANNVNKGRIGGLAAEGVRFSACNNTYAHFTKIMGHPPKLNPHAVRVSAGVVRLYKLAHQGYTIIRP